MRCLALAQAWQEAGGRAIFASADLLPPVRARLLSEDFEVADIAAPAGSPGDAVSLENLARRCAAAWIVVDGYHFSADYQRALKAAGLTILLLDDNGEAAHYCADVVLNQNPHAVESLYSGREPYTRLLLGTRYVLLRREFRLWREWTRVVPPLGRKLLVSMGGSDPGNVTTALVPALASLQAEGVEVVIVAGGGNPHFASLERAIGPRNGGIRLLRDVANMPELMAWADVMLAAAGTICWEIFAMGLPALLVVTAANQRMAAEQSAALGAAQRLDGEIESIPTAAAPLLRRLLESQTMRQSLSSRARELVDMEGSARVVSVLPGFADQ
jgi:UDP-2,4-diacetamido-2,4,6-trideoxy-beta-L-altropyranose hydrolase